MSETIDLHERYPLSRREDITDAFMRGFENGRIVACYEESTEKVKLRELANDMWNRAMQLFDTVAARNTFAGEFVDRMRNLKV